MKILIWVQLSVNIFAIEKLSRGGIYKTKITGKDIANVQEVELFKPSIQAEILQKSQEVEFIKPSLQAEILQHYQ